MGCLGISQYILDVMVCSPQRPPAPEARPKCVGIGPPAKPVLVRPTPQSLAPGSVAKAPKIPNKPVAAPILAQDWTAPESSECPSKTRDHPDRPGHLSFVASPGHPPLTVSASSELVRYSTLNSEHFPQPTQQIRSIIKQYKQPPCAGRPEARRWVQPPALSLPSAALYWAHHHQDGSLGNGRLRLPWCSLCWLASVPLLRSFVLVARGGAPIMGIIRRYLVSNLPCFTC